MLEPMQKQQGYQIQEISLSKECMIERNSKNFSKKIVF